MAGGAPGRNLWESPPGAAERAFDPERTMNPSNSERLVVISGAGGALGAAVARHLAGPATRLALLDLPHAQARLEALAADLGNALPLARDLSLDAGWDDVLAALGDAPTGAALCAGGWAGGTPVHAAPDDAAWRRMMTLNADTVHLALRKLLRPMVAARRGSVVVVGARPVERPWTGEGAAAYAASKAAAVALAQATAQEVMAHGVRVNAVLPSILDTPPNRDAMTYADPSKWVTPDSLARVVGFLLSDAAADVSGAAVPVYGRA